MQTKVNRVKHYLVFTIVNSSPDLRCSRPTSAAVFANGSSINTHSVLNYCTLNRDA